MAASDDDTRLIDEKEAARPQLAAFFEEAFGPAVSRFLLAHGDWMHRETGSRLVAMVDGAIAGYRAMIPTRCALAGREVSGVWAVNLYVPPQFRGRGLQRLLDDRVNAAAPLRMSFPGALGAKIYAKQGYALRDDLEEWHADLAPLPYWRARSRSGVGRAARRAAATVRTALFNLKARYYRPRRTQTVEAPQLAMIEDVFRRYVDPNCVTTVRDQAFLKWRYLDSPFRSQLAYYLTDLERGPTHYAIVRFPVSRPAPVRVLDVFGDLEDRPGLVDLLRAILRDGSRRHATRVEILVTSSMLAAAVREAGFHLAKRHRFRWSAEDPEVDAGLLATSPYWTLGDSDNDLLESTLAG